MTSPSTRRQDAGTLDHEFKPCGYVRDCGAGCHHILKSGSQSFYCRRERDVHPTPTPPRTPGAGSE